MHRCLGREAERCARQKRRKPLMMQLAVLRLWRELLRVAAAANQPIDAISYRKDREPRSRDRAGDASIMLRVIGHEAHRKCRYRNSRQQR
jgi:hypothetical protein